MIRGDANQERDIMVSIPNAQQATEQDERMESDYESVTPHENAGYVTSGQLRLELDLEDCLEENRRLQNALQQMRFEMLELNRAIDRSALPEDLDRLQLLAQDQDKRLRLMFSSYSWRITAPLRMLARLFGAS